jgi:hypothetical protein
VPAADGEVEGATGVDSGAGVLGDERRPFPRHRGGVGEGPQLLLHRRRA